MSGKYAVIYGCYHRCVSISGQQMQNPGKGRVGPPGPPGKQGPAGPKGSKGILGRETTKIDMKGKTKIVKRQL